MSEKPSEITEQELEQISGGKSRIPANYNPDRIKEIIEAQKKAAEEAVNNP